MSDTSELDFKLERYRFLNNEISILNKNVQIYLTQFQVICTSIIIAVTLTIVHYKSLHIPSETAILCVKILTSLFLGVSIFISFRILTGIFSWWDFRKEEVKLLGEVIANDYRRSPTTKNLWRWDETYSILIVLLVGISFTYVSFIHLIPLIK